MDLTAPVCDYNGSSELEPRAKDHLTPGPSTKNLKNDHNFFSKIIFTVAFSKLVKKCPPNFFIFHKNTRKSLDNSSPITNRATFRFTNSIFMGIHPALIFTYWQFYVQPFELTAQWRERRFKEHFFINKIFNLRAPAFISPARAEKYKLLSFRITDSVKTALMGPISWGQCKQGRGEFATRSCRVNSNWHSRQRLADPPFVSSSNVALAASN